MKPIQTAQCNAVLAAPPGCTIEECKSLAVMRGHFPNGTQVVVSFWKPDAEELAQLNAGEPVTLLLWGETMPPAAVFVGEV